MGKKLQRCEQLATICKFLGNKELHRNATALVVSDAPVPIAQSPR
jgi:hypothetical protein